MIGYYQSTSSMVTVYSTIGISSTPPEEVFDLRHDPKAWRTWFREFLFEKIPARIQKLLIPQGTRQLVLEFCRSGTWREAGWKMKAWKQALYGG